MCLVVLVSNLSWGACVDLVSVVSLIETSCCSIWKMSRSSLPSLLRLQPQTLLLRLLEEEAAQEEEEEREA